MAHNVVFRTKVGTHAGVVTWTSFPDKEYFDKWNNQKMQEWYGVIAEGVTPDQAVELCSTPTAEMAAALACIREANKMLTEAMSASPVELSEKEG
jgi:hypothetical protein